jgi:enoyl-CoA hydratase/carnithine racemase
MKSESSVTDAVLYERDGRGVITLTMNRPANFNALSEEMLAALQAALDKVKQDDGARAVVIAASGKAFCPGHNLKEMVEQPSLAYYRQLFDQCSRMMLGILKLPVPVIARVHGTATAAGCQLVAQCDLAVASDNATFAVSGVSYGLFCSTPSVPLLRNVAPKHAMEMLVTGDFISARQAMERGLVNRVVAPEQLDAEIAKLIASILDKPRAAIAMGKELVYRQREMGIEAAYQLAGQTMAVNMMDSCAQEGFKAFTEKRKPSWKP